MQDGRYTEEYEKSSCGTEGGNIRPKIVAMFVGL